MKAPFETKQIDIDAKKLNHWFACKPINFIFNDVLDWFYR